MHDFCFTYPYGIVLLCGGLVGFLRRGSLASLYGGVGAGILLLVAGKISLSAYHKGSNSLLSQILQTVIALSVSWVMGERFLDTGKVMPAGMVAAISVIMSLFYAYKLASGGNHIPKKQNTS
ncbi:hypothetical protein SELMODRAFT_229065 [Selaginella moellendorffii]|uniref:Uncharacterized protein n=1 Tax=Selaginella moellendorffii TaxID=88036 RepID=D8SNS3_SELML|nr:protein FATTY ACID EXPORT 5 [Selaginella moellendorffii]EFJ13932.1 hypothetical protein SELMODRAFT_229065 [Selaginella moellendorffii]|eukprot:XP_024545826.1 protein FATTY ACID EXPORT 5 [Selaginella moellendorffii]